MSSLSKRGFAVLKTDKNAKEIAVLKKKLTVKPVGMSFIQSAVVEEDTSFPCYLESSKKLYMPKCFGLSEFGIPDKDTICNGAAIHVPFKGSIRGNQVEPIADFMKAANNPLERGGILCMYPGFGKTVCALNLVSQLGVKTLIVVHKEFLMQQWRERIEQYLPGAKVGVIQGSKMISDGCDIVLAMLQSLSMKDYPENTFDEFGFLIVDECHHIGAEVFSRALHKTNFRYSLGLSATPVRKDGLTKVIKWFIGDVIHKSKKREDIVQVRAMEYKSDDRAYCQEYTLYNKPCVTKMINAICRFEPRTEFIIDCIFDIKGRDVDRFILVLSDRREHLTNMCKSIASRASMRGDGTGTGTSRMKVGFYVGGMKQSELDNTSETADIILATYSMAAEAMDIPKLNTLVLASPKGDVEQSIGRIQRQKPEDRVYEPTVIDIVDRFSSFNNQWKKRSAFYKKHKYNVEYKSMEVEEIDFIQSKIRGFAIVTDNCDK